MGESASHFRLVESVVDWIAAVHFGGERAHIFVDSPNGNPQTKPPKVGDFFPDAYAVLLSGGIVIGEAKTTRDIENRHADDQFRTYLRACSMNPHSVLVLGVPWHDAATAKSKLKRLKIKENLVNVNTMVLDLLRG